MIDVKVIQADRDAAASCVSSRKAKREIIDGVWDDSSTVQAFTRHRQAAEKAQQEREVDLAEAARIMFEASKDRFMRPEQCYPAITALHEAGFLGDPATAIRSQNDD